MTTPLEALLDYAFAQQATGLRFVRELALQKAHAMRAPEPEDLAQSIVLKLGATPGRARALLDTLAARNPGLAAAFESTLAGAVPTLSVETHALATSQLTAYIARSVGNATIDHQRRQRRHEALPESDRMAAPLALEEPSELLALRARVLAVIENDASRPVWFDATVEALEALATGERTMDELTAQCVAGDPILAALPFETARMRARNRLQQQHQRARAHLLAVIAGLVTTGGLLPDEGLTAQRWVDLLMRRQKRLPAPSRRSSP